MRARMLTAALAAVALLAGCSTAPADGAAAPLVAASVTPSPTPSPTAPSRQQRAARIVDGMSRAEQAGQVLMTAGTVSQLPGLQGLVRRYHLAGVMVRGRSSAGTTAVRRALAPVRDAAPDSLPLLTATDQEGGTVQVLTGPGFSTIPSAVQQARRSPAALRGDARRWGRSLAKAGIVLDLAPVADVPCASTVHDNPPVADLRRNYGTSPTGAGRHVAAFVRGMRDAGVETSVKHFPGLGCVRANTDTTAHVVDAVTTASSARLAAFAAGIDADAGFVMVSSASYSKIDPGVPALFSSRIIGGLLRDRMGFDGVVMSDDVGGAVALRRWSPATRATRFIGAGGDLLLDVVPGDVAPMSKALVAKAKASPAFAATLQAAAERVVAARLALR